jgi:histidine triad (HIT) family protein
MCVFCQLFIKNEANIIEKNENLMVIMDIDPINLGHVLIIPNQHVSDFDLLTDKLQIELTRTIASVVKALKKTYNIDGYSVMQNGGTFCEFGHLHIHVFPRIAGDGFDWKYGEDVACDLKLEAEKIKRNMEAI